MTQVNISQKSFSGGEISPGLESRTDLEIYQNSLSDSLNVMCTNRGELIPRPGTEFIGLTNGLSSTPIGATKRARLIPFKFSEKESYMFEISNISMRIYKDGKPLNFDAADSNTYESISSSIFVHESQYPIVGNGTNEPNATSPYNTESGEFVFNGDNAFEYEAGAGPFTITDIHNNQVSDGQGSPVNLSYFNTHIHETNEQTVTADSLFWIHSVERRRQGKYTNKTVAANSVIGKTIDIVRITWHPKYCEGGSEYDPNKYLYALYDSALVTSRPAEALFPATKWTFFTATLKSGSDTTTDDEIKTTSQIDYNNFFGPTDLTGGNNNGFATSPIPYLESEIYNIQYAIAGDKMFLTHPNHQPIKITRVGPSNFKVSYHRTIGGPWRNRATYPNTLWGGAFWMTAGTNTQTNPLPGADSSGNISNGPAGSQAVDLRKRNGADEPLYLFKSNGSPDINTSESGTIADDSIVGRKLRINCPVGFQLFPTTTTSNYNITEDYSAKYNNEELVNVRLVGTNPLLDSTLERSQMLGEESRIKLNRLGPIVQVDELSAPINFWFEGEVEALVDTSGPLKHMNPTPGFRYRIIKPANVFETQISPAYVGATALTKIGHLFEEKQADGTGGWPSCVAIVDNRLVYASNDESPNSIAFSSKGDFDNWEPDDWGFNNAESVSDWNLNNWSSAKTYNGITLDYHGFTYDIEEGLADKILWLKSTNYGLVAGTPNAIYMSNPIVPGEAITPGNFSMRLVSEEGSSPVPAEYIDGRIYYLNKLGNKLLSMQYVNDIDGFVPRVESFLSDHLVEEGIRAIAHARTPVNVIWLATNSGELVSAVHLDNEERKAFFKHRIAACDYNRRSYPVVDSIAVIPSEDNLFDQLWMTVRRHNPNDGLTLDSQSDPSIPSGQDSFVNTTERLTQYSTNLRDSRDFIGLDCSISDMTHYDGSLIDTASYKTLATIDDMYTYFDGSNTASSTIINAPEHGLSGNDWKFMLKGIVGNLDYWNYGDVLNPSGASHIGSNATTIYVDSRTPPGMKFPTSKTHSDFIRGYPKVLRQIYTSRRIPLPGAAKEKGVDYKFAPSFFNIFNNFSFFENGLESFASYSLGEFEGKVLPPNHTTDFISGASNRVFYVRNGSGITSGQMTNDQSGTSDYNSLYPTCYSYTVGFRPDIYWTTLPPRINSQLGNHDTSNVFITNISAHIEDTHQIKVRNLESDNKEIMIEDEYTSSEENPGNVERRSGVYFVPTEQLPGDLLGKIRFEPAPGYPFRILSINWRGERATRI